MKIFFFVFFIFLISCTENKNNQILNKNSAVENIEENESGSKYNQNTDEYPDGTYCAEVEYFNPNTGTRNSYDLDVEVENGELTSIHWPNGGWLDESHFIPEDIIDGECEFTSDRGYQFTVILGVLGGCGYTEADKMERDLDNEVEESTCPNCGNEKDNFEEYCDNCKNDLDNIEVE